MENEIRLALLSLLVSYGLMIGGLNMILKVIAFFTRKTLAQSELGKITDMIWLAGVLYYVLSYTTYLQ